MSLVARLLGNGNSEPLDRRQFLREGLGDLVAGAGIAAGLGAVAPKTAYASVDQLTDAEINNYMRMNRVEDILGGSVEYITPQTWDRTIENSDKPALVLVYNNRNDSSFAKRSAIIFKQLAKHYGNKVNFYACENEQKLWYKNIKASPSIAMYSRFDLVNGETPQNNDGRMKQIDVLRSGPKRNNVINSWTIFGVDWIATNLTNPNYQWAWRLNNSWNEKKVFYNT